MRRAYEAMPYKVTVTWPRRGEGRVVLISILTERTRLGQTVHFEEGNHLPLGNYILGFNFNRQIEDGANSYAHAYANGRSVGTRIVLSRHERSADSGARAVFQILRTSSCLFTGMPSLISDSRHHRISRPGYSRAADSITITVP